MYQSIRKLLAGPIFAGDDEKTRLAGVLNPILLLIVALVIVYGVINLATGRNPVTTLVEEGAIALFGLILILVMRRGRVRVAAFLLSITLWAMITAGSWFSGGLRGSGMSSYFGIILIAGLLLGGWGGIVLGGLGIVAGGIMLYGESSGMMPPVPPHINSSYLFTEFSTVVIGVVGLLYLATRSLSSALARARNNERAQIEANRELQALRDSLEQQVAVRTRDLERRSAYLEAAAEIGRTIVSILDVEQIGSKVTTLLSRRFDLSQVTLFMLDETGQWAEAHARSRKTDQQVQLRPLRLAVDDTSLVGWSAAHARLRVIDDVHTVYDFRDTYILTETRSVIVLPVITRERVIGVLSAENARIGAFDQDTIAALRAMAELTAVAFDNARLFAESQQALESERRAYGIVSREAWLNLLHGAAASGYSYADRQLTPLHDVSPAEVGVMLSGAQDTTVETKQQALAIPISVRGQVIGLVDVQKQAGDSDWTPDETVLVQTVVEQLGVALDSARLYQDTQRRAAREQLAREVTAEMRRSLDVTTVLRTAIRQLQESLNLTEAEIWIEGASAEEVE